MSLPSQSSRSARSSSVHYRRSQNSPIRRMLPAILVLIALVMILWFALIRPSKNPDQQANTSEQTNAAANLAENGNTNSTQPPVEISNSAPTRSLPGSGNRPDPQQEAENTIADSSALEEIQNRTQSRNQPQNQPQSQPQGQPQTSLNTPQNQPASTSLLDATRNQPTQTTQQPTTNTNRPSNSNTGPIGFQLDTAQRMVNQNDRVGARELLSRALHNIDPSSADGKRIRDALTEINRVLVFGPVVAPTDPMCEEYKIKSGDSLSRIASRRELATHWKLIQRVNRIANPSRIRLDQTIKLVRGPFHAVVYKSKHRMDIYHGSPNNPDQWLFITSLNVGLGADNGTPLGVFTISTNKLENPGWVNPRDASERYTPDDPANPIGEYWLGLDGVGEYATLTGYGIHGTIDPDSIGDDQSMGCVRLADQDIALVYELLAERVSVVEIRP